MANKHTKSAEARPAEAETTGSVHLLRKEGDLVYTMSS